jgi:hypothetical protein
MGFSRGPKIITDGLVLALDAGSKKSYSGSGTAYNDLSGNGNNGTLTNSPTFNSNGDFEFDGVNDYVSFGNPDELNFTDSMSHAVWFTRNSNGTGNLRLTSKAAGGSGTNQQGFTFFGGNSSIVWGINVGGVRTNLSATITVGPWYYVVGTANFSTGTQHIYLNGEEITSGNLGNTNTTSNSIEFRVGSYYSESNLLPWDGNIGPVSVYNKALTAQEVLQNYNATKSRFI